MILPYTRPIYLFNPIFDRRHPIENVIDGTEAFWMSPPLSRGQEYQRVNITVDLHQVIYQENQKLFKFTVKRHQYSAK